MRRPVFLALLRAPLLWLLLLSSAAYAAAPTCPADNADFPTFYEDGALFAQAIAKVDDFKPSNERLTGITVPHHLLADHLVALGFKAASAFRYKRIVILSPDHFRRAAKPFATTGRGFETAFGPVRTDRAAAEALAGKRDFIEESCLFAKDHGVQAMLPFIHHYFPEAQVLPVAMSIKSRRADWDRLAEALAPLVDKDTLVVESTDFSHYLPQHQARRFDQQTLNVLASGSLDMIAALHQPDHADSVGALYVQTKLQQKLFDARPLVIANENSQQYVDDFVSETTSYMVVLFGRFEELYNNPTGDDVEIYYLAGDTNFGRGMKKVFLREEASEAIVAEILKRTKSRPLIVNLEGVILPNVPEAIDDMTLAMPEELALTKLRALNLAGAGLANNHAMDLGNSGYLETLRALKSAGIPAFGQGELLSLPGLDIVGLSDLDTNASRQTDLLTPALLDRLQRADAGRPVIAFVHWGQEYRARPGPREKWLADQMRLRSVTAIVGAHPHVGSAGLDALAGGDTLQAYSLGNFLFDQDASRSSGSMLEIRVFKQGTIFARLIPLPNFFEMGRANAND